MRILAIGDFHGKFPKKLKDKIKKENVDLIVGLGDYPDTSEMRNLNFKYWNEIGDKSLREIIGEKKYKELEKKAIKSQFKILKELTLFNKPIIAIYGNADSLNNEMKEFGLKGLEHQCKILNIKLFKTNFKKINNFILAGFSGYRGASAKGLTEIDKNKKIKASNKKWESRLKKIFSRLKNYNDVIFIGHDVPYNYFDKINNKQSPLNGKHIGDKYFTKYIKKYQPELFLCGHMHEYQGMKKLGKTKIVAIGPAFEGKAAIIEIDEKKKIDVRFIK
ncbi:metallophosphoesterase [Candidatus Pacearchaeota archaeon]|nr:metallophosphoesterase [Candidatus Pacearchaeota archaeon]